ncbi:glycosyltransferase family 2 protein, partial [Francisella tularensis subsp. holarctica]|nr:glycosyltransferase family 2 protein [Francisella tularensis subsp. holarctica]
MKKTIVLKLAMLGVYCHSLAGETFAGITMLLLLLSFVFYLFITSKSLNFNLITRMYVVLIFAF